ncbi:MAG: UvrD-helicase domain-containing protein [Planctomycetes bacterium]|nr:UvrD-helicase domain-containing protein [Planctomycetota bacterium]
MTQLTFTRQQQQAVTACGHSVIVSAAAGSGKTAVLAARCAYLVCDAPDDKRCHVDELLVVTFTEAAAAEMRSRIVEAIRERASQQPDDPRLREQVALADVASISTVHAFCHRIVRGWFSELDIDPSAALMDEHEAALLRREVLEELCQSLYATDRVQDEPLGPVDPSPPPTGAEETGDDLSRSFVELVDTYGLSDDREIRALVLKLSDFVSSLPDPDDWLTEARNSVGERPERVVLAYLGDLRGELVRQQEHVQLLADQMRRRCAVVQHHAGQLTDYAERLGQWIDSLPADHARDVGKPQKDEDVASCLGAYDKVRESIGAFSFSKARAPSLPKDAPAVDRDARKAASRQLSDIKKKLFQDRLRTTYGLFTVEEWIEGLRFTAPFVATITRLVERFRAAYAKRKRHLDVLDFNDLERLAYELVSAKTSSGEPADAASTLRRRYAYVLVDEFQDINPIQQAIIRQVSREPDPSLSNNLFVVGDLKQSIYRFRLAEPSLFTARWKRCRRKDGPDEAIPLQTNFRSRPEILDTVNLVFRQLMGSATTQVVYDAAAELEARKDTDFTSQHIPVDLHVLDRSPVDSHVDDDAPERGLPDFHDAGRWSPIEREGYLIGSLIKSWTALSTFGDLQRPLEFRDIAVLLRASRINAERIAGMLTEHGVPSYAEVGGSLLAAREVRDVWAALQTLDNPQQDIPLAAVLRSGILGDGLSEDDLVELRCFDRSVPFHEAVREYARKGKKEELRKRVHDLLERIARYRRGVRRRPLADVLWSLYEGEGFLAYTGGLPNGRQRQANLFKLHELARKFGTFRRQGLHRFLRFVESLEDEDRSIAAAPALGEAEDVVRIMSVHQSKGLEFPVVFLAGLGTKFNLGDRAGRMIFERNGGIGLRVVDRERMVEYRSAAHARVAGEVEFHTRDEERRILYVAMTRAKTKLILVGSLHNADRLRSATDDVPNQFLLTGYSLTTARTPLDWLLPVLASAPTGTVTGIHGSKGARSLVKLHIHDSAEIAGWSPRTSAQDKNARTREAAARLQPLPAGESWNPDDPRISETIGRTEYVYPYLSSGACPAVVGASSFKGTFDYLTDPEQRTGTTNKYEFRSAQSPSMTGGSREESLKRGVLTHRVLEHLDFSTALTTSGVASELQRMIADGVLSAEECELVDKPAIEWFVATPLGRAIGEAGEKYRREFAYIATEPTDLFDTTVNPAPGDDVLVRGMVDGILPHPDGERIDIIDFKTDAIGPDELEARVRHYRPQMELYARAMSRLWRKPVDTCRLVFLSARRIAELKDLGEAQS